MPENIAIFLTSILIISASYFGAFYNDAKAYSLVKLVYVFMFFFFGVVPLNDEMNKNLYWGGDEINEFYKIVTNSLILIGLAAFFIGSKIKLDILSKIIDSLPTVKKVNLLSVIFLFGFIAFIILYLNDFSIPRLLFRGVVSDLESDPIIDLNQMERLLFDNIIRPMPLILLVILYYIYKNNKSIYSKTFQFKFFILLFIFFFSAIFLVMPTSIPRFQSAALYISLLLVFANFWDKSNRMQLTIFFGLILIMPFLDKFRNFDAENFKFSIDFSFLNQGHFDAYQNFTRVVEIDFFTGGQQLLGSLLFFIPRSFWESKPIGSGHALAEMAGYDFANIAMPFIAEGYINFGIFGVAIFMFIFGLIVSNFDRVVWNMKKKGVYNLFICYYYLMFGMIFFMMRGDLMSSFAYTSGLTIAFWFLVVFLKFSEIRLR